MDVVDLSPDYTAESIWFRALVLFLWSLPIDIVLLLLVLSLVIR